MSKAQNRKIKEEDDKVFSIENITEKEKKLLQMIRDTEFGEMKLIIQNGQPDILEEVKKSIKL